MVQSGRGGDDGSSGSEHEISVELPTVTQVLT